MNIIMDMKEIDYAVWCVMKDGLLKILLGFVCLIVLSINMVIYIKEDVFLTVTDNKDNMLIIQLTCVYQRVQMYQICLLIIKHIHVF